MALNFSQQDDIFDPKAAQPVTVIGAGSVGSQLVMALAKIGVEDITVYDDDAVESHNIPNSAYGIPDLSMEKTLALQARVLIDTGVGIKVVRRRYAGEKLTGSVVACVDWMDERQKIWNVVKNNPNVNVLVDTRTAVEMVQVFAIRPSDPEDQSYYEHFLYRSDQALRPTCGTHGIIYVSGEAADKACRNLTAMWATGKTWERHFVSVSGRQRLPER